MFLFCECLLVYITSNYADTEVAYLKHDSDIPPVFIHYFWRFQVDRSKKVNWICLQQKFQNNLSLVEIA